MMEHHERNVPRHMQAGLKAVAMFEATKGLIVLTAALGILSFLHKDVADEVERLVWRLHLNPEGHISQVFLHAARNVTNGKIWAAAGAAFVYAVVRFVEAYGLWHTRTWAEWFALLSGAVYLPWEIYEVSIHPSRPHMLLFAGNLAIILYMLYVRVREVRSGEWQ